MKRISLTLLLLTSSLAFADLASDLPGDWQYDGFFYQNHRYANPNPELKVTFTFNEDHTERLYWKRDNEAGFCERKGTWKLQDDTLIQTTTWINPENDSTCASDPDMQPSRVTKNQIAIWEGELDLHMSLDGQDFIYILRQIENKVSLARQYVPARLPQEP